MNLRTLRTRCTFCSIADVTELDNRQRFPTVLTFATINGDSGFGGLVSLINHFRWRIVLFVWDELSAQPQIAPFYAAAYISALKLPECQLHVFECKEKRFDSTNIASLEVLLDSFRQQARSKT